MSLAAKLNLAQARYLRKVCPGYFLYKSMGCMCPVCPSSVCILSGNGYRRY